VALLAAVAVYLVVTITYALTVPVGSSADEPAHLNYARLIADHAGLPGAHVVERQQPPLYYLLGAGLLRAGLDPVALRFLSIVIGLLAVWWVALTVRTIAPGRPWLAAGTAGALALLPGFQFVSASISDDGLAIAAGSLLLLVTTRVALSTAPSTRLCLAIGAAVGVGLLAKETDLPLVVVLAGVAVWRWRRALAPRHVLTAGAVTAAIAGWWYVRNLVSFHSLLPPLTPIGVAHDTLNTGHELGVFTTLTIRGLFSPERYQGSPVDLAPAGRALIGLLAVATACLAVAGTVAAARGWRRWAPGCRAALAAHGLAAAGVLAFSLANSLLIVLMPQGRYLMVAAGGPLLAMCCGAGLLGRSRGRVAVLAGAWAATAITLSIMGLATAVDVAGS
jgi:hypothetical protein